MKPRGQLRAVGPALGGMGSRALTPTMRSPWEELKPRAGWGNFLAYLMCGSWSLLSGLQLGQTNEQRARDQISSVSGNTTRNAEAIGGGQVSAPRMRTDVPGVLWALTALRALSLPHFRTLQRGVPWGARG